MAMIRPRSRRASSNVCRLFEIEYAVSRVATIKIGMMARNNTRDLIPRLLMAIAFLFLEVPRTVRFRLVNQHSRIVPPVD